jgi:hypothetical protein
MMILGYFGIGFVAYRRKSACACASPDRQSRSGQGRPAPAGLFYSASHAALEFHIAGLTLRWSVLDRRKGRLLGGDLLN